MERKKQCFIYTRVSTAMQVEGYSLDAQAEKLKREAEYRGLTIAGEFPEEGKSGKSIEGRPKFKQMIQRIKEMNKDEVQIDYVMVFKLSRFGRNAKDVLVSLEEIQSYGCELICVEDGIDSSKDAGKLMISVLAAVAEIERENIRVQTMEGRNQKAREGKWNGGRAPYGYKLVGEANNKHLEIDEEAAEHVRIIFEKFAYTSMGANGIAKYMNTHGYKKEVLMSKPNADGEVKQLTSERFSAHFVKVVLDNPTYAGFISYNRRVNEKVKGESNKYHRVHNEDYDIFEGSHEGIITPELWVICSDKRKETGVKREKTVAKEHEHLLSGLIKCPVCGKNMYGKRSSMKKKKDGTYYPVTFCYFCKHQADTDTSVCTYRKQPPQMQINEEVVAIVMEASAADVFKDAVAETLDKQTDKETLQNELAALQKAYDEKARLREMLTAKQDALDPFDEKTFNRKYEELEERKDKLYDEMDSIMTDIESMRAKISVSIDRKVVLANAHQLMDFFKENFHKFDDSKKKELLNELIESVDIYPERNKDGRLVKSVKFKVPVRFKDKEMTEVDAEEFWCNYRTPDETVVLLEHVSLND